MIQDIAPHKFDNHFSLLSPGPDSVVLYYEGRKCLMKTGEMGICFPTFQELEADNPDIYDQAIYLFAIDDTPYFLLPEGSVKPMAGYGMENTGAFRQAEPQYLSFAGITGQQLYNWYRNRQFCGRCGSPMRQDEKERMMRCDNCGNMEYPKICPAVIVGVIDQGKILLTKYQGNEHTNRYALIAGFAEIGETIEDTVKREVMEETGMKVKNLRFYKSQPWSFSDSLLMGFYCDVDGPDNISLEKDELAVAEWFEPDQIPVEPKWDSLTNEMILRFKNQDGVI